MFGKFIQNLKNHEFHLVLKEMQIFDKNCSFPYVRISTVVFEESLRMIALHITMKETKLRQRFLLPPS